MAIFAIPPWSLQGGIGSLLFPLGRFKGLLLSLLFPPGRFKGLLLSLLFPLGRFSVAEHCNDVTFCLRCVNPLLSFNDIIK